MSSSYDEVNNESIINAIPQENPSLSTRLKTDPEGALRRSNFSLNIIHKARPSTPRAKTNCRRIEIPLIVPHHGSLSDSDELFGQALVSNQDREMALFEDAEQSLARDKHETTNYFPFLALPFELRLKIYALVLPSRNYAIVTQYPQNGSYYSATSIVSHMTQTLYPVQPYSRPFTPRFQEKLTTYKLLNANFHRDFPNPSIFPELLRTCKQIRNEAEPVMYGGDAVFDFGWYIDAIVPFLQDRSALARRAIRYISVAREISAIPSVPTSTDERLWCCDETNGEVVDVLWTSTSKFLKDECAGLRKVDLTIWAENGEMVEETLATSTGSIPGVHATEDDLGSPNVEDENQNERSLHDSADRKLWYQWEWTSALLQVEEMRHVRVTWWGFAPGETRKAKFDSWLGQKMVADKFVRSQMISEGRVIEGVTVIPGKWHTELIDT